MASQIDIEYMAGLLDGEGCITISRSKTPPRYGQKTPRFDTRINIANTHLPTVLWAQTTFGGAIFERNTRDRPLYILSWSPRPGRDFLRQIFPFLRIKREQAALLEAFFVLREQTKHSTRPRSEAGTVALEIYRAKISDMN